MAAALLLGGCSDLFFVPDRTGMERDYKKITQEEAKRMMAEEEGYVILDVRRPDEYAEGHIPGAVCLPNESIGEEAPAELPDPDQIILVYCRSGNRSKEAASKLFRLGYRNVYEFGGIVDWTGEIVKGGGE
ncbi:MAG: rhodanese-like domain-containing protein [Clostridia bacterium]|nr:rhodanese-like domain-containing protein [Clostridia bacterium]